MNNGKSRLQQTQEDVEEVKVIMLDNWNKAEERGEKLENLEDRSEKLLEASKRFEKTTSKLAEQNKPKKMKIVFIVIGVVVALVVLGVVIYATV